MRNISQINRSGSDQYTVLSIHLIERSGLVPDFFGNNLETFSYKNKNFEILEKPFINIVTADLPMLPGGPDIPDWLRLPHNLRHHGEVM